MSVNRLFNIILRIYPRAFRERFGPELKLDLFAELGAAKTKLEVWRLVMDAFLSAIWERLQGTEWIRSVAALSCLSGAFFLGWLIAGTRLETRLHVGLETLLMALFAWSFPAGFLAMLSRVPYRLEWIGALAVIVAGTLYVLDQFLKVLTTQNTLDLVIQQQTNFAPVVIFAAHLGLTILGAAGLFARKEQWQVRGSKIAVLAWMMTVFFGQSLFMPVRGLVPLIVFCSFTLFFLNGVKLRTSKSV